MSNGSAAKRNTLTTPEWIVMSALWGREPQVLGEIIETIGDRVDWKLHHLRLLHEDTLR